MIDIVWTPSEVDQIGASRLIFRRALRRWRAWRGVLVVALGMGCLGFFVSFGETNLETKALTIAATFAWGAFCMLLCWGLSYLLLPRRVRRLLGQERLQHREYRWQWSETGLLNESANSHVRLRWDELAAWAVGRDYLLFYISEAKVLFVGKRAMTEEQVEHVMALAVERAVPRW